MPTGAERALIDRLAATCLRLDHPSLTRGIIVGIQTSADAIYHLERLANGRYRCHPKGAPPYEVAIEDAIMKPLISGAEAKRYEEPLTDTYLLFPYERGAGGAMRLMSRADLERRFPKAWAYLRSYEDSLRARESGAFDDDTWWRLGRNQNLDKHDITKLIVAQTTPEMRVCADTLGGKYLNNVRVNGILATDSAEQFYLLGVLNGTVADFVFRRIAKPKAGGYFEANRQFIAPLPVPDAAPVDRAEVARMARELQTLWSARRDSAGAAAERLSVLARARHGEDWLWPDLPSIRDLEDQAPRALKKPAERRDWAKGRLDEAVATHLEALQARLDAGDTLEAAFVDGELCLFADGAKILGRIFLDPAHGALARAYWQWLALSQTPRDARRFAADLRRPPVAADSAAAKQFIDRVADLAAEVTAIEAAERAMNERLYQLYALTEDERLLVENAAGGRNGG